MTMPPTSAYALDDMLSEHLGAEQKEIVTALLAVARFVSDKVAPRFAPLPVAVGEALSVLEQWCGGKADAKALWATTLSLENSPEPTRVIAKESSHEDLVVLLLGILRKAMYEDHDDWPAEVVQTAIAALCRLGEDEPQAVQSISSILASHGLL